MGPGCCVGQEGRGPSRVWRPVEGGAGTSTDPVRTREKNKVLRSISGYRGCYRAQPIMQFLVSTVQYLCENWKVCGKYC